MSLQQPENPAAKPRRTPHRMRVKPGAAAEALKASRGLIAPAARALGTSRSSLQTMIKRYARLEKVVREQRGTLGDFAESQMVTLMSEKHWPAIQFYLSTQCRDRGYVLPKGTALNAEVSNTMMISSVIVNAVPSGKYLAEAPGAEIEVDGRSLLGGREVIDVKPDAPDETK
jgi:hypothetical protein